VGRLATVAASSGTTTGGVSPVPSYSK
jgi:hypothetical protein